MSTTIFLTQTKLDLDTIKLNLAQSFFETNRVELSEKVSMAESQSWEHYRSGGQILDWDGATTDTESKKENFRRFIQNEVYINYTQPTLLFLGELGTYSDTLQEGMLKLLEEPPKNLQIVIFAMNKSKIKGTILSRCNMVNIPTKIVFENLNQKLVEKVKKLPEPRIVVENLLKNNSIEIEKISDWERSELDFWLWQIQTNLEILFKSQPQRQIANKIISVLTARNLNTENVQKKFAVNRIWL